MKYPANSSIFRPPSAAGGLRDPIRGRDCAEPEKRGPAGKQPFPSSSGARVGTEDGTGVVCAQQQAMRGPGAMRGRGMR